MKIDYIKLSQVELPRPVENKRESWVENGKKNSFSLYLAELKKRSALHNAILTSKILAIHGGPIKTDKKADRKTQLFISNPNPYETLDELRRKFEFDLETYGSYYMEIIWGRGNVISEVYHMPYRYVACGIADDRDFITEFYLSNEWDKTYQNPPSVIEAFKNNGKGRQLLHIRPYDGEKYYPLPSYVGALTAIESDAEIANFHLASLKNGMTPDLVITFINGDPTEEERRTINNRIEAKFTGTDKTKKHMILFAESKETVPIITPITPADIDKQYIQVNESILQNILSGHRVTSPLLVGIKTAGQLGGGTEMAEAYSIYKNSVILPDRKIVLDSLNKIGAINGLQELIIEDNDPINVEFSYSEETLTKIMTVDELRLYMGLEPLGEGVTVINSITTNQTETIPTDGTENNIA